MTTLTEGFDEKRFERQVDAALVRVRTILDTSRHPTYPADVAHKYDDKYMLVDFLTNTALATQLTCLELLGLTMKGLQQMKQWSGSRSVTLRLKAEEKCTFDREVTKEVEDPTKYVTEYKGFGAKHTVTDKVVTKVTEYFWKFDFSWTLLAYQGNNPDDNIVFQQRSGTYEICTGSSSQPRPKVTVHPNRDVSLNWLFQKLTDNFSLGFSINRVSQSCRTPRRNPDVESALSYFRGFVDWYSGVDSYFRSLFSVQVNHGLDLAKVNPTGTFIPVTPLFEEAENAKKQKDETEKALVGIAQSDSACVLRVGDVNSFLIEEKRSLLERIAEMEKMFPNREKAKIISSVETSLMVVFQHCVLVSQHYFDGVNYVEAMLRKQLISAIGKEVQAIDFVEYMLYHNRTIFKSEYQPRPFSYAVRRPNHDPEGLVTIDADVGADIPSPIQTIVSKRKAKGPMFFSISAATKVFFGGERYLHGWMLQEFSGYNGGLKLTLNARARQFSTFILMVGKVSSAHCFEPKHAIIIKNKDELKIPLLFEKIPTPQEFADATDSLSPEQQRFCKAYRGMQLANTLFAVCVIQIKPQLEKLMKLHDDSLTKEIKLTQNLLELLTKYQIPSDLLSYDGPSHKDGAHKLNVVKKNVAAMLDMIENMKKTELEEQKQVTKMARLTGVGANNAKRLIKPKSIGYDKPQKTLSSGSAKTERKEDDKAFNPEDDTDYSKLPLRLDAAFQQLDEDRALHSTIITPGVAWVKSSLPSLLALPSTLHLSKEAIKGEKNGAFDLIDALSLSGSLCIDSAELHVILAATHCFDSSLMDTVIKQNINPIEKVERSTLILAMNVHNKHPAELLKDEDQTKRVSTYSPKLFLEGAK